MKKIILLFLVWRTALFLLAYISPELIQPFGAKFPYYEERLIATKLPHFIWSFANFDGVHYLGIAKDLYAYQYTQVFFPLYPLLIKLISPVFFGNLILAGLFISNAAFLAGLLVFNKMIKKEFGEKIALWSTLFLLSFPTSFYFGSLYTEGLFFLLTFSSFYYLEKSNVLKASLLGLLASATRLVGVSLLPALIIEKRIKNKLPLLLIPLGLVVYMAYLQMEFKNAFYFLTAQAIFEQGRSTGEIILLPQVFYRYIKILTTTSGLVFANAAFELLLTLFALTVLVVGYKKIPKSWLIFSALVIITPTLTGTLTSMPRYVLGSFPIFVILAQINSTVIKLIIILTFLTLLTITTLYFTQGYWVA